MNALFQDREIYIRSNGKAQYWRISAKAQFWTLLMLSVTILAWAAFTASTIASRWNDDHKIQYLAEKQAETSAAEKRIAAYRNSLAELARDLDARQMQLEEWQDAYFGKSAVPQPQTETTDKAAATPIKISLQTESGVDLPPEARKLIILAARQDAFSAQLLAAVRERGDTAENAVRKLGLNPKQLLRSAQSGMGGPFIPYPAEAGKVSSLGGSFAALDQALFRMEVLERTLVALPSGNPTAVAMLSSSYGYRRDPFTGAGAMHSGLDFPGPIGSPIYSAAPGRISFVGVKSGYGKVMEVDHGQGIMTRYAHLSGFGAKLGQQVAAGQQIAKMGSTGRSTGSHLHFEVRLNGAAVNPRRFLEAHADVREAKADARQRVGFAAGRVI